MHFINLFVTNLFFFNRYKQIIFFAKNLNTKVKGNIMKYWCLETIFAAIVNGSVELLYTKRKVSLVLFTDELSKK